MSGVVDKSHPALCAIVLAGGESKRMGTPKMLLPFGDMTMIEKVICNIKNSGLNQILVVLGAVKEPLIDKMNECGVNYCINENYREGMLSSVICGMENTEPGAAVLICPGDQPLIKPSTIKLLNEEFVRTGKRMAVATYKGRRGHPLIIHPAFRDEITGINPAEGLRELLKKHPEDVLEVEVDDIGILKDFDTFDEYRREINQTT